MLLALIIASLAAAMAGSGVFFAQAMEQARRQAARAQGLRLLQDAQQKKETLTPRWAAQHLNIPLWAAERLLRFLVEDGIAKVQVGFDAVELRFVAAEDQPPER